MGIKETLSEVKDLIAKGFKFDLLLEHLKKSDKDLYERLQKASAKYYTEELQNLISERSQGLLDRVEEIYRDRKLEEIVKEAIHNEFTRLEEKLTASRKRTRIVEILFVVIGLHIGSLASTLSKPVKWQTALALLLDVAMLLLLAWLYKEN